MGLNGDKVLMLVMSKYLSDPRPRRQAEALAAAGKQVEVLYCTGDGGGVKETVNGVLIHRVRFPYVNSRLKTGYIFNYISFFICAFLLLTARFFALKPKSIVIHSMPNFLVFTGLIPKLFGARVILDVHDIMPELYSSIFKTRQGLIYRLLFLEERISCAFASELMTANDLFAQTLQARVGRPFFVVHNSPDPKLLSGAQRPITDNGKLTLFHHGNIHKRCGIDRVLPALKQLKQHHPTLELQIHGGGPFSAEVKQKANALGVSHICHFGGGFSLEELPGLVQDADIALVTNRVCDFTTLCMPIKLLEYVECKLPVVCARMKTASFYFDDSMVYFVDTDDEIGPVIEHIIAHPEEAKAKAEKAYEKYLEIAWAGQQHRYVDYISNPVGMHQ